MKHAIEKGNLLFQDQIGLPERSGVDKRSYVSGWECVEASTVHDLTREIKLAGWTLFRMAREIRTATFGFNREAMEKRAADRLIQAAKSNRVIACK